MEEYICPSCWTTPCICGKGLSDKEIISMCVTLLKSIKLDAQMALNDEWDRNDEGFESQIIDINRIINLIEGRK